MAYQKTDTPKNKRRGQLSKFDLAETYFRGGVCIGYEQALAHVRRRGLQASAARLPELEKWAEADPSILADPPGLTLGAA